MRAADPPWRWRWAAGVRKREGGGPGALMTLILPLPGASVDFALPVLLNRRHPLLSPPPSLIHQPPLPGPMFPLRSRHCPSHVHPARSIERVLHHISRSSISWAHCCLRPRLVLRTAVPLQRHCFMFSGCPRSCAVVAAERALRTRVAVHRSSRSLYRRPRSSGQVSENVRSPASDMMGS